MVDAISNEKKIPFSDLSKKVAKEKVLEEKVKSKKSGFDAEEENKVILHKKPNFSRNEVLKKIEGKVKLASPQEAKPKGGDPVVGEMGKQENLDVTKEKLKQVMGNGGFKFSSREEGVLKNILNAP